MKHIVFGLILFLVCLFPLRAEMQFPIYENLPLTTQKAWNYTVQKSSGNNPGLSIHVPRSAAKYCTGARLYIRDGRKRVLAEINLGLNRVKDGGLDIKVDLFEQLRGTAELIVYTGEMPGAPAMLDFGGFTFTLSNTP
jgi:hypothetical protein